MQKLLGMTALLALAACGEAAPVANEAAASNETAPVAETAADNAMMMPVAATPDASAGVRPLLNIAPGAIALIDPNNGRSREIAFGTDKATTTDAATRALGEATDSGSNGECGEGAMDYARFGNGLSLWFQEGKFVGWFVDKAGSLSTASGAAIGSTRASVADAIAIRDVPDSSLGREFTTANGNFSGLLDGPGNQAKVTALWSGQACIAR